MPQTLITLSLWIHSLATVILIGHYLLLSILYLPVLSKNGGAALSEISKRSRVWLYVSMGLFLVTGSYLTFVNSNYLGLGNFGNLWALLMLVKHLLVIVMLALGFWFNAILRVGLLMGSNTGAAQAIARFRWYSNAMAITGALILLLTAISQAL